MLITGIPPMYVTASKFCKTLTSLDEHDEPENETDSDDGDVPQRFEEALGILESSTLVDV